MFSGHQLHIAFSTTTTIKYHQIKLVRSPVVARPSGGSHRPSPRMQRDNRRRRRPMDERTQPPLTPTAGASTMMEEIVAIIAAEKPHGLTAADVARLLGLGLDGEAVQVELEDLVARSLRDRRGFGCGAVSTVGPGVVLIVFRRNLDRYLAYEGTSARFSSRATAPCVVVATRATRHRPSRRTARRSATSSAGSYALISCVWSPGSRRR